MRLFKPLVTLLLGALSLADTSTAASQNTPRVAVVSVADDARYAPRRADKRWPGQSTGRLFVAARLGFQDAQIELQAAGLQPQLHEAQAADSSQLATTLAQLQKSQVPYWLLDLPDALLPQALQAAQQAGALAINVGSAQDALRAQC